MNISKCEIINPIIIVIVTCFEGHILLWSRDILLPESHVKIYEKHEVLSDFARSDFWAAKKPKILFLFIIILK